MGSEAANLKLIKDAYTLWSDGTALSFEHWMALMADELHWRSLGGGVEGMEFSADRSSKQHVQDYFMAIAKDWEMEYFRPEQYLAEGDWVVMRGRCAWRHRRTGKVVETPKADFLRLQDGKVVEFHEFYDTAAALAATR